MDPSRRRLWAGVLVVVLMALAGCNGPVPPTAVVCDGCLSGIAETGSDPSRSITVEESVTHVYAHSNGSARVEARIRLAGSGVDDLRGNETLVDRLTNTSTDDYTRPAFERTTPETRIEGQTLVVTYRVPEFTERRLGGTVFTDRFVTDDGEKPSPDYDETDVKIATDRLVVHSPEGMTPVAAPPDATVDGTNVVFEDEYLPSRTYLVFGQDSTTGRVLGHAAVTLDVFRWAVPASVFPAAFPVFLIGGLAAVLSLRYAGETSAGGGWNPSSDRLLWTLAGTGWTFTVWVGLATFAGSVLLATAASVVSVAVFAAAWRYRDEPASDDEDADGPAETSDGPDETTDESVESDHVPAASDRPEQQAGPFGGAAPTRTDRLEKAAHLIRTRSEWSELAPRRPLAGALGTLGVAAVALVLVAIDWTGGIADWVLRGAVFVPFLAFPTMGYAVTDPKLPGLRAVAATACAVSPVLVAFSAVVSAGATWGIPPVIALVWCTVAAVVGTALFYAALWLTTR